MVSKTRRHKALKRAFDDLVGILGSIPGIAGIVGNEWPEPEFVVFFTDGLNWGANEDLMERVSDAMTDVMNKHLDVEAELHVRNLGGLKFTDYDLAACDFVFGRGNGD